MENRNTFGDFVRGNDLLDDAEYSHTRAKGTCLHEKENPNIRTIDYLVIIDPIADVEFAQLVWQHHVVGTVPMWSDFIFTKRVFTGPSIDLVTNSFMQFLSWYSELTTVEGIIGLYKTVHEETGDKVAFIFFTKNIEDGDFLCLWKFSTMRKRAIHRRKMIRQWERSKKPIFGKFNVIHFLEFSVFDYI